MAGLAMALAGMVLGGIVAGLGGSAMLQVAGALIVVMFAAMGLILQRRAAPVPAAATAMPSPTEPVETPLAAPDDDRIEGAVDQVTEAGDESDTGHTADAAEPAGSGPVAPTDNLLAAEETVSRLRRNLRRFSDNAPLGVLVVRTDGCVVSTNVRGSEMTGLPKVQEGGEPGPRWPDLVEAKDRDAAEAIQTALRDGQEQMVQTLETQFRSNPNRVVRISGTWVDRDSGDRAVILYLVDATEQRSLEAQFAQSQKMQAVGQLAGGVAHDFNNLLTAMIGFSDLLLMRHPPGDPSYADIVHIKQNANRAAALVRQLLAFSRRQTLRPKVLNLTDVLADLSNLLRRLIGEHLSLRIVHDRDLGLVKADQGQIEQVVTNLVVNARDAMDQGGTVSIETRNVRIDEPQRVGDETMPVGDYVEIAVIDSGHGISQENLSKIFEPFFTTKAVGHGTGLGLATVYGIVRQTGGYVLVQSAVGEGTTFRIMLPRIDEEQVAAVGEGRRSSVDLTGQGTVLLVEDEDAVRRFAVRALRNKGYTVLEADGGEAALDVLRSEDQQVDLMVSDVVMPNMDGPSLIRKARELRPDIRAIFISGYAEEAFRRSLGDDLTDVDFLAKPFSLKDLAAKVKEQLDR